MVKEFFIKSFSCPESRGIESVVKESFNSLGVKEGFDALKADFIVVNSCATTRSAEEECVRYIKNSLANKRDGARVVVTGCLASIGPKRLGKFFDGVTIKHSESGVVSEKLRSLMRDESSSNPQLRAKSFSRNNYYNKFNDLLLKFEGKFFSGDYDYRRKDVYYLTVLSGCMSACSYCAIRFARGRTSSRSEGEVLSEFSKALSEGFREFVIVGDDVGTWGKDLGGRSIASLLESIVCVEGDFRVSVRNFSPEWLLTYFSELSRVISSGKIKMMVVPLQSASDSLLKLMRRKYLASEVIPKIVELKKAFPGFKVFTHLMINFPGESEEDFVKSLELYKSKVFDVCQIMFFEPVPGTEASRMIQLSQKVKNSRKRRILAASPKRILNRIKN